MKKERRGERGREKGWWWGEAATRINTLKVKKKK